MKISDKKYIKKSLRDNKKIIFLWGILIFFLALYFYIIMFNMNKLMDQVDLIVRRPYEVLVSTDKVNAEIDKLKVYNENLKFNSTKENIKHISKDIENIYANVEGEFLNLRSFFDANDGNVRKLYNNFHELKKNENILLKNASDENYKYKEINKYMSDNVNPYFDKIDTLVVKIQNKVDIKIHSFYMNANDIKNISESISIIMFLIIILGLIAYQISLNKKNKIINYKNSIFDTISKNIAQGLFLHNLNDPNENFISESSEKLFGIKHEKLLNGYDLIIRNIDEKDREEISKIQKSTDKEDWEYTFDYHHPISGEVLKIKMSVNYVDTDGEDVWLTVYSDETDQVLMQESLKNALEKAEKANEAKSDFLSRMSHEIRTPLNGIIGMVTLARENINNKAKEIDCVNKISASSKHLLVLINDILDMSKIESGKVEIKNKKFGFRNFVESTVSLFFSQAKEKGIKFKSVLIGNIPSYVKGDYLHTNQIIVNLLSNAVKFTDKGGEITNRISLLKEEDNEVWIRFEVSDTGVGIEKKNFDKIFNPFEQEDASVSYNYGGTGLGLPIAKRFTQMLGGNISLKSEVGKGSIFTVDLPFTRIPEPNIDIFMDKKLNILLIDSMPETLERMAYIFETMKIDYMCIGSGECGIKEIKENPSRYDICMIYDDLNDMSASEVIDDIKDTAENDIKIIVSSYDTIDIMDDKKWEKADAFINKPMFISSIIDVLYGMDNIDLNFKDINYKNEDILKGKNVLIVEDNELNMEILRELLILQGCKVTCAVNGEEGVKAFEKSKPYDFDIIFMDIRMPVMDGYEATEIIRSLDRKDAKEVIIISISANAFADDIEKSIALGMNAHISKPINIGNLIDSLNNIYNKKDTY
ncbi:ATP-binding protein [Anaerofustis stercorihominis]|uniref:response regulator n=1 Tax=Anaerofustis stercorihominis TaxID=214853 RepID=UPI00210A1E65|nr:response regulator [Anaerofustis stercorihominis]MCQ4794517.1 ATP-binding protein [Anaerofustis stercorihominis]